MKEHVRTSIDETPQLVCKGFGVICEAIIGIEEDAATVKCAGSKPFDTWYFIQYELRLYRRLKFCSCVDPSRWS